MKGNLYGYYFLKKRKKGYDPEILLRIIFKKMIRDANVQLVKRKCSSPEEVAQVFQEKVDEWTEMCNYLKKYPINKDGFIELLAELQPQLYLKLVQHGLNPLKERTKNESRRSRKKI